MTLTDEVKGTPTMTVFANEISDLMALVSPEIGTDVAASILIAVAADYGRGAYGPDWLERAKDILEQKKTAPMPQSI